MSAVLSRYLTRKNKKQLNPKEEFLARLVCGKLLKAAKRAYKDINVLPGKSQTLAFSKMIMNGDFNWLTEDICDVVRLSRPENNQKYLSDKVRLSKLGKDEPAGGNSDPQSNPSSQARRQ